MALNVRPDWNQPIHPLKRYKPMNVRKNIQIRNTLLTLLCLSGIATAQESMPEDAARLKRGWQDARARAVEPLDAKYLQELEKLLQAHTKAGRLDAALAIRTELASIQSATAAANDVSGSSSEPSMTASDIEKQFVGKKWATEMWEGKWQIWDFQKTGEVVITRAKDNNIETGKWHVDKKSRKMTIDYLGVIYDFSLSSPTEGEMNGAFPTGDKKFKLVLRP